MAALTAAARTRTPARTATIGAAVLATGCLVLAAFDFLVATHDKITSAADYLYTLNMYPILAGLVLLLAGLRAAQHRRDRILGTIGFILTVVGVAGAGIDGIATLITKNPQALGPTYLLGTFLSIIGMILFAIASIRARVLPWWAAPALAFTWTIGGLLGDGGPLGFKGSALLLAAAAIAAAAATPKAVTTK